MLNSIQSVENRESFYNVIRVTGYGATPFFESLGEGISGLKASANKGHKWDYRPGAMTAAANAHAEGSVRAPITSWSSVELGNQFQIFKKTSGITGSQAASFTIEEKVSSISTQEMENRKQLRLDVEKALLGSAAPVGATLITDIRTMGGILHYIPANAVFDLIDAVNGNIALDVKNHIDEALKLMFNQGIVGEEIIVMCGSDVYTDLNWYYADKNLYKPTDGTITAKKDTITTGWHEKVRITANPNLLDDEAIVYAPGLINPVLLRSHKSKDVSDATYDAEAKEDLFELTVQVLDPYAAVSIKNIGRTV